MKKILLMFVISFMLFGMVSAVYNMDSDEIRDPEQRRADDPMIMKATNEMPTGIQYKKSIEGEGQMMINGKTMSFSKEGDKLKIQSGEHSANCEDCNLSQEGDRLQATMSNGMKSEIKVMPDRANERALERLQLKNKNSTIELKEVGAGNATRMAYGVTTKAKAKAFWFFDTEVDAEVEIDAETGEIIKVNKPWWAKLEMSEDAE